MSRLGLPTRPEPRLTKGAHAVDRARAELVEALKHLDGEAPSPVLHKLRTLVLAVDDIRGDLS